MAKFRVPLFGSALKSVTVDSEATKGATLGRDLYRADGSVVTEADLVGAAQSGGTKVAVTLWKLIQQIPANIAALAALATSGYVRRNSDGTFSCVTVQAYPEGTSNPPTPTTGEKFYRTDLNLLIYYDGTRWLTVNEYEQNLTTLAASVFTTTDGAVMGRAGIRRDFGVYMTRLSLHLRVDTTNDASNYWTYQINAHAANLANVYTLASPTTIGGGTTTYFDKSVAINAVLPSTAFGFFVIANKTAGTPGQTNALATLYYRLVVP